MLREVAVGLTGDISQTLSASRLVHASINSLYANGDCAVGSIFTFAHLGGVPFRIDSSRRHAPHLYGRVFADGDLHRETP